MRAASSSLRSTRAALGGSCARAYAAGIRACAIVFLHGYRYPAHELAALALAREAGFTQVSVSHQVSPLMKLVPRGDTTVVDAYLSPILRRYVDQVSPQRCRGCACCSCKAPAGWPKRSDFHGKDAILSGPAGGIVGMVASARAARVRAADRLRHGRHLDGCEPLCRRIRARVRHRGGAGCGCARP